MSSFSSFVIFFSFLFSVPSSHHQVFEVICSAQHQKLGKPYDLFCNPTQPNPTQPNPTQHWECPSLIWLSLCLSVGAYFSSLCSFSAPDAKAVRSVLRPTWMCRHTRNDGTYPNPTFLLSRPRPRCVRRHPGVYLDAAAKLGVPPTRCLALEDSLNGVRKSRF